MKEISHEQLEKFYELSLDLFCLAGSDGYFKFLNPAWEKLLGYDRKELLSQPYISFVHPEDQGATSVQANRLSNGKQVMHFENRYKAKNGGWIWLSWMAAPEENGDIYAVARDITGKKDDEVATQALLRKLELTNHELDQFAYIVSHDLKTPLRGIINLAEWIVEDIGVEIKPEVQEHVAMLKGRVSSIQNLIDDLLKYARTGRDDAKVGLVDLSELLSEIRSTLQAPEGFEIQIPEKLPAVHGARVELLQLFQNLLSNAIKYRSSDRGKVKLSFKKQPAYWEFSLEDDGIGIAAKHHAKIFDVFHRVGEVTGVEGTGIGLAIVKKIIDAVGGQIHVKSDGVSGTTFTFTWPKRLP